MKELLRLTRPQRRRLERAASKERDAEARQRYRIILSLDRELSPTEIHELLGAARSTVYRVVGRFRLDGEEGLRSVRHEVAPVKLTEAYMERLEELILASPRDFGWERSTWTCELLARQLLQDTGIRFHRTHVWRLVRTSGARWGRPRPAPPGWAAKGKKRGVRRIQRMIRDLDRDELAVYADEVDIHLNPKIGPCWMSRNTQTEVETPGKNEKRYVFGGLNPKTGYLVWTAAERKNSAVFIDWLKWLSKSYRPYRAIHVVCDNYIIHKSKKTLAAVAKLGRIRLHFLPPYSPEHNPIERLWGELHANITRNHRCRTMTELMEQVRRFLMAVVPYPGARPAYAAANAKV